MKKRMSKRDIRIRNKKGAFSGMDQWLVMIILFIIIAIIIFVVMSKLFPELTRGMIKGMVGANAAIIAFICEESSQVFGCDTPFIFRNTYSPPTVLDVANCNCEFFSNIEGCESNLEAYKIERPDYKDDCGPYYKYLYVEEQISGWRESCWKMGGGGHRHFTKESNFILCGMIEFEPASLLFDCDGCYSCEEDCSCEEFKESEECEADLELYVEANPGYEDLCSPTYKQIYVEEQNCYGWHTSTCCNSEYVDMLYSQGGFPYSMLADDTKTPNYIAFYYKDVFGDDDMQFEFPDAVVDCPRIFRGKGVGGDDNCKYGDIDIPECEIKCGDDCPTECCEKENHMEYIDCLIGMYKSQEDCPEECCEKETYGEYMDCVEKNNFEDECISDCMVSLDDVTWDDIKFTGDFVCRFPITDRDDLKIGQGHFFYRTKPLN